MRLSHARRAISVRFDDPNLVSCVGLVPVMALAARCGLAELVTTRLTLAGKGAANPAAKILALVAGMIAGADSISDMDVLRHGGMDRLFEQVRAPSTLGTFLRRFTFGHVRQLDAVAARLLARLAVASPILGGADQVVFVDLDDTVRQTYGYAKQGTGRGYTGVNGLNALLAILSTPVSAPVIAATRLRRGATNSVRGAAKLLADTLATARRAGAGGPGGAGLVLVRADSAFYGYDIINTCRRARARFSITARQTPAVSTAIAAIDTQAWTPIRYRHAIYDDQAQRWISDAEVAETEFTAFTGRRKTEHVTARLIVRRVRRLNPAHHGPGMTHVSAEQQELFAAYRYHAVFTDSPEPMLTAEATHRDHAIVEQVIADLKDSALAHLPSGHFGANGAWLVCAAIAHNLTRAAGALASAFHARARTGTIRAQLIHTPARLARSAHRLVLHLPQHWPWETGLDELFRHALHDPVPTAA
ncbi:MAG: IS1380 family transposase [Acidimicrobiia bacterium]|nr:IS1380 family transposase [Acidimicrobiia bacterium]